MPDVNLKKYPMPSLDADVRNKNFEEVSLGYTYEIAKSEAKRCLQCKTKPCVNACPVNIDIPGFIKEIENENLEKSFDIILQQSTLPAVCGRVCPQETQCESACVRGIKGESVAIGRLERFVADWATDNLKKLAEPINQNGDKVAIIGAGPTGLTAAGELAKKGYEVVIYEALHLAGGVLVYGIPEFRLPKKIVKHEIDNLIAMGVKIKTNMVIGKILTIDELFEMGYKAVYVGSGAGLPHFMNIPGEDLNGVYSANEYLTRVNLMKAYLENSKTPIKKGKKVAVVGGGNVAMDAARCALRLGAESVYIVYRRGMQELPARQEEIEHAIQEGIILKTLTNPIEVLGDQNGQVCGIKCVEMQLCEPDASGRRRPVVKNDSEFVIEIDTLIISIGTSPNPLISNSTDNLEVDKYGCIITNGDNGLTTKPAVWAGGDAVTGAASVILAMGAGKKAALAIDEYIKSSK